VFQRLEIDTLSEGMLDVLARRALSKREPSDAKRLLRELFEAVPVIGPAAPIAVLLDLHQAELVDLLLRSEEVRNAAAQAIAAVVPGDQGLGQLLEHRLTRIQLDSIREFATTLGTYASDELRKTCESLQLMASELEGHTIGDVLSSDVTLIHT